MNLETVTVELRPRGEWEAAELGVRMIRRDAAAIYRVWFAVTLPLLALAFALMVYSPYPTLAIVLYWWLEPLADGPVLRIISRRLFGEEPDVRDTLGSVPELAWRNIIFLLPPYRFHFARSIAMPVTQLEALRGAARRSRAKLLNARILNHGIGVTAAYQHLAIALYLGVVLIGFALVPTSYQDSIGLEWLDSFWNEDSKVASALSLAVTYLAQTALQPWFVGAGFGLYINCRTQLEAWDIEVAFRRMVQRRTGGVAAAALVLALALSPPGLPGVASAQDVGDTEGEETSDVDPGFSGFWDDEEVLPALDTVLASEKLSTTRDVEQWQSVNADDSGPASDNTLLSGLRLFFRNLGRLISYAVEFGLWIVLGLLLWLVFVSRRRWLPYLRYRAPTPGRESPVILAGATLSADSLPGDIPAEAARLWQCGARREALSLLYRGSVHAAVTQHGIRLSPCATEESCMKALDAQAETGKADYFRKVVSAWMRVAYGDREPQDDVLALCGEWSAHFGKLA